MAKHESQKPAHSLDEIVKQAADDDKDDQIATATTSAALSASDMAKLEEMTKEELIALVRASNAERISYALLTQEERIMAYRMRLHERAMKSDDDKIILQAIQQLLDRLEGKPAQTIAATVDARLTTQHVVGVSNDMMVDMMQRYIERQKNYITVDNQ